MQRRHLTGAGLVLGGLSLAAIQAAHALQQTDVPVAIAVDALPFVAMGLGVAFAGVWAWGATAYEAYAPWIGLWSVAGMVALAAVSALVLFGQQVTTGTLARASYLTMDLVTVGAVTGVLVGLYDVQSRHRLEALEVERDRIEAFAGKAADVNNYGRAIYTAQSRDGVAAYVVEAVSTLVDLEEAAVVVVEGARDGGGEVDEESTVTVVASTVESVSAETIGSLAIGARSHAARDVVVEDRAQVTTTLPETVQQVVSVLVTDDGERATVVLALGDGGPIDHTDRELLELVASHAAATLRRLDADPDATPI